MTTREKFAKAQKLVKAKNFAAALDILKTIDHNKARQWEKQIHAHRRRVSRRENRVIRAIAALMLVALAVLGLVALLYAINSQHAVDRQATMTTVCLEVHGYVVTFDDCWDAAERVIRDHAEVIDHCMSISVGGELEDTFVRCLADGGVRF